LSEKSKYEAPEGRCKMGENLAYCHNEEIKERGGILLVRIHCREKGSKKTNAKREGSKKKEPVMK